MNEIKSLFDPLLRSSEGDRAEENWDSVVSDLEESWGAKFVIKIQSSHFKSLFI